jgi:hypothetical protein
MENKKYWFKRKRYGYGFYPVTKEGWGAIIAYLIGLTILTILFYNLLETEEIIYGIIYTASIVVLTTPLIYLSYKKSPKPKWRWGKKDTDNPEEDF